LSSTGIGVSIKDSGSAVEAQTNDLGGGSGGRGGDFRSSSQGRARDLSVTVDSGGVLSNLGVSESAVGGTSRETAASETSAIDDDWLSSPDVTEGWGDGGDDWTVVEVGGLQSTAGPVVSGPGDGNWGIEQPGVHWSSDGDLELGNTEGGSGGRAKGDLNVGQLVVNHGVIEEISHDGDGITSPTKIWGGGGDHWTVGVDWARDDLGLLVPPHGDGSVLLARVGVGQVVDHNLSVIGGDNGDILAIDQDVWLGLVEPLGILETNTGQGDLVRGIVVEVAASRRHSGTDWAVVVSWSPNLEVVTDVGNGVIASQLDVDQDISVEVLSS